MARRGGTSSVNSSLSVQELEGGLCAEALARAKGNVSRAAKMVGMTRAQLDYRIAKGN
jgi:two-component system, NtrC family, response regulator HydG